MFSLVSDLSQAAGYVIRQFSIGSSLPPTGTWKGNKNSAAQYFPSIPHPDPDLSCSTLPHLQLMETEKPEQGIVQHGSLRRFHFSAFFFCALTGKCFQQTLWDPLASMESCMGNRILIADINSLCLFNPFPQLPLILWNYMSRRVRKTICLCVHLWRRTRLFSLWSCCNLCLICQISLPACRFMNSRVWRQGINASSIWGSTNCIRY